MLYKWTWYQQTEKETTPSKRHLYTTTKAVEKLVEYLNGDWKRSCGLITKDTIKGFKRFLKYQKIFKTDELGFDYIIGAGGAVCGHPMGITAGAKAFRQAIDVVMKDVPFTDAVTEHEELKAASKWWGILGEDEN